MAQTRDEITGVWSGTCKNCHYDQVDKKKVSEEPCKTCFAEDKSGNRFPKFKEISHDKS